MTWAVEYTDEFEVWWLSLTAEEQNSVDTYVRLVENMGPNVPFPYSSGIQSSKYGRMRELRVQHEGKPYRVLYAFDPRRAAILLIGGDKTGDDTFYERMVPLADRLYKEHLATLRKEGLING